MMISLARSFVVHLLCDCNVTAGTRYQTRRISARKEAMKSKENKITKAISQLRTWFLAESWPFKVLHVDLLILDYAFSYAKKSMVSPNDMQMAMLVCQRFFVRDRDMPHVRYIVRTLGFRYDKPMNPVVRFFMHLVFALKHSSTVVLHNVETLQEIACVAGSEGETVCTNLVLALDEAFPNFSSLTALTAKCPTCKYMNHIACVKDLVTCSLCGICYYGCSELSDIGIRGIRLKDDVEKRQSIQRDTIERRLRMEARDDDEGIVARLVEERRRTMIAGSRCPTPTPSHVPKPSREKSCKALEIPDAATRVRKQVVKEASQEAQRKHECHLRDKEEKRVAHLEELLRIRRIGEEIGKW